ncbi:hypothetical protein BLA60_37855 [Actinophytocola xinjiangensis]|uniref:Excreted virulence factor EspC (Type VII ESX diderm) n=1 Tax=Actinophytocola xinjiangensis TaxID=485602 RepID=A0A7Z1AU45_9PSEU|nr:type VII secretion target [Actinophytocola xinjiangensis]OLF05146.1 hypothetical protein BLA60_37855 [Actinophytocola xinjiangensis]
MDGFTVDPAELDEFAKHVDGLVTDLGETQTKLADTRTDPLVFGLVGQFFAIAVALELSKAKDSIGQYQEALSSLYESVKQEARNYEFSDEDNAKILSRQM